MSTGSEGGRWEIRDGKRVLVHRGACERHPDREVVKKPAKPAGKTKE